MERVLFKQFEKFDYYQNVTLEYLKDHLTELDIEGISLDNYEIYKKSEDVEIVIMKTDKEHPFTITNKTLYINHEWFLENQELVLNLVNFIVSKYKKEEFTINNKDLIDDIVIKTIASNSNIKKINLTPYDIENPYDLTVDNYKTLKESGKASIKTKKVVEELENTFDPILEYNMRKPLINGYSYKDLKEHSNDSLVSGLNFIELNSNLVREDLPNVKFINPNCIIYITEDIINLLPDIISELKKNNISNKLIIKVDNKEAFNEFIMDKNLDYPNIDIRCNLEDVSLPDYLRMEKKLYNMVYEARHLSPFEKYIVAYNIAKSFKKYKENDENKEEARNLYSILENEYIVCVGFSNLFGDLLDKLGLKSVNMSLSVDTSYDLADSNLEAVEGTLKETIEAGHARRIVKITDEKYGIDGVYFADPTWDNDLNNDFYNHLALTGDEVLNSRRFVWLFPRNSDELLYVNSIEEFYFKLNFILDKINSHNYSSNIKTSDENNLEFVLRELLFDKLEKLDPLFLKQLKEKYPFINSVMYWKEDLKDLIYDIGEYLVNHSNKEINGETIFKAVSNVYRDFYHKSEDEIDSLMPELISSNQKRQEIFFPKRNKVTDSDTEVIMNASNKFSLDEMTK